MKKTVLYAHILLVVLLCIPVNAIASAIAQVARLNEQLEEYRRHTLNSQKIKNMSQEAIQILSGQKYGVDYNRRATDDERDTARQAIFHRVLGLINKGKTHFSLKEIDCLEDAYIGHLSFLAVNHMAAVALRNHKAGFLFHMDEVVDLLQSQLAITFNQLKFKNEKLKEMVRFSITTYSRNQLRKIIGSNFMEMYLDVSRGYPDIAEQWLIQVRDIQDKRPGAGSRHLVNDNIYYKDKDNHDIAIELTSLENEQAYPFFISYKNQFFSSAGDYTNLQSTRGDKFKEASDELLYNNSLFSLEILQNIFQHLTSEEGLLVKSVSKDWYKAFYSYGENELNQFVSDKKLARFLKENSAEALFRKVSPLDESVYLRLEGYVKKLLIPDLSSDYNADVLTAFHQMCLLKAKAYKLMQLLKPEIMLPDKNKLINLWREALKNVDYHFYGPGEFGGMLLELAELSEDIDDFRKVLMDQLCVEYKYRLRLIELFKWHEKQGIQFSPLERMQIAVDKLRTPVFQTARKELSSLITQDIKIEWQIGEAGRISLNSGIEGWEKFADKIIERHVLPEDHSHYYAGYILNALSRKIISQFERNESFDHEADYFYKLINASGTGMEGLLNYVETQITFLLILEKHKDSSVRKGVIDMLQAFKEEGNSNSRDHFAQMLALLTLEKHDGGDESVKRQLRKKAENEILCLSDPQYSSRLSPFLIQHMLTLLKPVRPFIDISLLYQPFMQYGAQHPETSAAIIELFLLPHDREQAIKQGYLKPAVDKLQSEESFHKHVLKLMKVGRVNEAVELLDSSKNIIKPDLDYYSVLLFVAQYTNNKATFMQTLEEIESCPELTFDRQIPAKQPNELYIATMIENSGNRELALKFLSRTLKMYHKNQEKLWPEILMVRDDFLFNDSLDQMLTLKATPEVLGQITAVFNSRQKEMLLQ